MKEENHKGTQQRYSCLDSGNLAAKPVPVNGIQARKKISSGLSLRFKTAAVNRSLDAAALEVKQQPFGAGEPERTFLRILKGERKK